MQQRQILFRFYLDFVPVYLISEVKNFAKNQDIPFQDVIRQEPGNSVIKNFNNGLINWGTFFDAI